MFTSILNQAAEGSMSMSLSEAAICTGTALILGIILAVVYMLQGRHSKQFTVAIAVLPALIQVIILMVNGNLGTSVAILGAFGLVRFRSVPGTSRDILCVVFAMAIGLATGTGYITFAVFFTIVIGAILLLLSKTRFGEMCKDKEKELKITIPESLDYTGVFDDIFEKYTKKCVLENVKTTNLGSMYELKYCIELSDIAKEKEMIDELRCRNGNLTIICGKVQTANSEL